MPVEWDHEYYLEDRETTSLIPISLAVFLNHTRQEALTASFFIKGLLLCTFCWACLYKLSHYFSNFFFATYAQLTPAKQAEWNSRIVSNINAVLMISEMVYFLPNHPGIWETIVNPSVPYPPLLVTILMCRFGGYMLYDFILMVIYRKDFGDPAALYHHSISLLATFYFQYQGQGIWYFYSLSNMEATTPFVNQHWYFTISNMKGSVWYVVNGIVMFLGFFVFRVVLTTGIALQFAYLSWPVRHEFYHQYHVYAIPIWLVLIASLNYFWFYKITKGMIKALTGSSSSSTTRSGPKKELPVLDKDSNKKKQM